jgi:o-succinylbenzoate---CoA ligase
LLVRSGSLPAVPSLVAVALSGQRFVDALTSAWSAGDAVLPLDPRFPRPARLALLEALRPGWVIEPDGTGHRRAGDRAVSAGDALVVATSGTTGEPKGVVLTHDAVRASALATSRRLGVDAGTDHWLACLPLAHVGGLSVVTRALVTGTELTVHDRFDAAAVDAAAAAGATLVSLVSAALRRIDAGRWRCVVLGGDTPPRRRPPNVVITYGLTETGSGIVYDGLPLDDVDLRVDADGQILVRAPMTGRAYRTSAGDVPLVDDSGWLPTGDAGHFSDDGRLVVHGRIGDLIVTGGEKVWPVTVERVLHGLPGVAECAVVGVPDVHWGHRVVAVIVATTDAPAPTPGEVRELVKKELPPYAAPQQVVVVDALPRTPLGKIRRQMLVDVLSS